MAVAARKPENDYRHMPAASATRVYVDSRVYQSSAVPKYEPEEFEEFEEFAQPSVKPALKTRPAPKTRASEKPHASAVAVFFKKVGVLATVFCIAAALIGILVRYAMISAQYDAVNALKSEISQCEIDLNELKVRLNSAVNIEEAREAAERAGMDYPTAEQIVRVNGD